MRIASPKVKVGVCMTRYPYRLFVILSLMVIGMPLGYIAAKYHVVIPFPGLPLGPTGEWLLRTVGIILGAGVIGFEIGRHYAARGNGTSHR